MKNITLDKPTPVQFSENGVSQLVKLRIVNIQHLTKNYMTKQIWKEVRFEFYLKENNRTAVINSSKFKLGMRAQQYNDVS